MPSLDHEINNRITDFVAELTALIRESTLAAVTDALSKSGRNRESLRAAMVRGRIRGANRAARPPGAKRSPAELKATTARLLAHVKKSPGERVEQIVKAVGIPTKDLALPIKKLVASGEIKTTGERRATRYFPTGKTASAAAPRARRARRAKKATPAEKQD